MNKETEQRKDSFLDLEENSNKQMTTAISKIADVCDLALFNLNLPDYTTSLPGRNNVNSRRFKEPEIPVSTCIYCDLFYYAVTYLG